MKKEKQVKSYQRRTKSGKMVTVRAHTASYEAAERANEMATKKGAGKELEDKMKNRKEPTQLDIPFKFDENKIKKEEKEVMKKDEKKPKEEKTTKAKTVKPKSNAATKVSSKSSSTGSGISKEAYKAWYHFNDWDSPRRSWPKEVRETDSALRKQMGKKAYDKYCSDIDSSYSSRGHLREFKKIGTSSVPTSGRSSRTVSTKDIEHALGWDKKHSKGYDAAFKKVTSMGYRKTSEVKEGMAKLGYDYDTGKKIKPTGGELANKKAQKEKDIAQSRKSDKAALKSESKKDVISSYQNVMNALKSGKSVKSAVDKYRKNYLYHEDHFGSSGLASKHKSLIKALASNGYDELGMKAKTSVPRKPSSSMPKRGRTSDSETGAKKTKNASTELDKHLAKRKTESWEKYTPAYNDVTVGKKKYRVVTSGAHGQKLAAFDLKDGSKVKDSALYEKILDKHIFPRSSRSTKK